MSGPQLLTARLSLAALLALSGWTAFMHSRSPFASAVSSGGEFAFALADRADPGMAVYRPSSRTLEIFQLPRRAAGRGGAAPETAAAVSAFFDASSRGAASSGFYIAAGCAALADGFRELGRWRSSPGPLFRGKSPPVFAAASNFGPYCRAALVFEALALEPSGLVLTLPAGKAPAPREEGPSTAAVTVEVLNASGRRGAAEQVTRYLRARGVDVLDFRNHGSVQERTKIVDCSAGIEGARTVRDLLGLGGLEIHSRPEPGALAGVRVVLGLDFDPSGPRRRGE